MFYDAGDSNVAFFRQLSVAGLSAATYPVMSVSIAESELQQIGPEYMIGHYASWSALFFVC